MKNLFVRINSYLVVHETVCTVTHHTWCVSGHLGIRKGSIIRRGVDQCRLLSPCSRTRSVISGFSYVIWTWHMVDRSASSVDGRSIDLPQPVRSPHYMLYVHVALMCFYVDIFGWRCMVGGGGSGRSRRRCVNSRRVTTDEQRLIVHECVRRIREDDRSNRRVRVDGSR